MTKEKSGAMSSEAQIRGAIEEGMENIATAIFGENLSWTISFTRKGAVTGGLECYEARAQKNGGSFVVRAIVPMAPPDGRQGNWRIDDMFFKVEANDWAGQFTFKAWCEDNPNLGAKVIVVQQGSDDFVRYLLADSMEGEVLLRGNYEQLPVWAKSILARHYDSVAA